jgi:hypothetical protein
VSAPADCAAVGRRADAGCAPVKPWFIDALTAMMRFIAGFSASS